MSCINPAMILFFEMDTRVLLQMCSTSIWYQGFISKNKIEHCSVQQIQVYEGTRAGVTEGGKVLELQGMGRCERH